jgi:hypothetical protein
MQEIQLKDIALKLKKFHCGFQIGGGSVPAKVGEG